MAIVQQEDLEKDKKDQEEGEQPLAGQPAAGGAGAGAGAGGAPIAASQPAPTGSGSFTNIKKFLDVNRPKIAQDAAKVSSGLLGGAQQASHNIAAAETAADTDITEGLIDPVKNVGTIGLNPLVSEATRVFEDSGYTGKSAEELDAARKAGVETSQDANAALQRTATEGGVAGAFRSKFGGRGLTLAERNALSQAGGIRQNLADVRQSNQAAVESLAGYDPGYADQIEAVRAGNEATRGAIIKRVSDLSTGLSGEVQAAADKKSAAGNAQKTYVAKQFLAGTGPEFAKRKADITEKIKKQYPNMSPADLATTANNAMINMQNVLKKKMVDGTFSSGYQASSADVMTPEQKMRASALEKLAGLDPSMSTYGGFEGSAGADPFSDIVDPNILTASKHATDSLSASNIGDNFGTINTNPYLNTQPKRTRRPVVMPTTDTTGMFGTMNTGTPTA